MLLGVGPPLVDLLLEEVDPADHLAAAELLSEGTAFAPEIMARVFGARAAAGTRPTLLAARERPGGRLVGAALLDPFRPVAGGRWFTRVAVAPESRGLRVGSALVAALRATLPAEHPPLCVEVDGADERAQQVAVHWGGVPYQRSLSLAVDLACGTWRTAGTSPERAGVTVEALRADSPETDWQAAFAVYAAAALDLPDRAGAPAPDYAMFRAQAEYAPGVHLAWRHGVPVGLSGAGPEGPDSWYVFFTGTLGSARRSGVARALKTALHATAAAEGVRTLTTSTLDVNVAMLGLNASLGYCVTGSIVRLQIG